MSRFIFVHDFYRDGYNDMLFEVQDLQAQGLWTKERRARVAKHEVSIYHSCKHKFPRMDMGYWAGRVAAIKSARTSYYPTRGKLIFCALPEETTDYEIIAAFCKSCGDKATWECGTLGGDDLMLLCDRCKQERVRELTAYITPDGWDWDEHEDQLLPLPVPVDNKLRLLEEMALELVPMTFPWAFLLGFSLSHVLWPTIDIAFIPGLCIILLVRWQSANMVRFVFGLYRLVGHEKPL